MIPWIDSGKSTDLTDQCPAAAARAQQATILQHPHVLLRVERDYPPRDQQRLLAHRPAAAPGRATSATSRAVWSLDRGASEIVLAFASPPPNARAARAAPAGRCRRSATAPRRPASAIKSMKSSRASSAQWMSSNTSTVGPSSASASTNAAKPRTPRPDRSRPGPTRASRPTSGPSCTHHPLAVAPIRLSAPHRVRSFVPGNAGAVRFQDARLGLHHLTQRPQCNALAVGKRAAPPPRDHVRQRLDIVAETPRPVASYRSRARR